MKHKKKDTTAQAKHHDAEQAEMVENLQKENDELLAKLQRLGADYANYQKQAAKQTSQSIQYEKQSIIKTLLPALDNFEHTLQNAASAENADVLIKGIKIIYDQMLDILKSHGIEQIEALGEHFDPALHEAMMQRHEPEQQENIVLEEFQKGYKLNGRVIRPSKVIVNKPTSGEPSSLESDESQEHKTGEQEALDECETIDTEQSE